MVLDFLNKKFKQNVKLNFYPKSYTEGAAAASLEWGSATADRKAKANMEIEIYNVNWDDATNMQVIMHEYAHNLSKLGTGHGKGFIDNYSKIAGYVHEYMQGSDPELVNVWYNALDEMIKDIQGYVNDSNWEEIKEKKEDLSRDINFLERANLLLFELQIYQKQTEKMLDWV